MKPFGKYISFNPGGRSSEDTEAKEGAIDITILVAMQGLNARQLMLNHKQAHGSRCNLSFPTAEDIKAMMEKRNLEETVEHFGDGSHATPTKSWAALGGYGVWIPNGLEATRLS